MTEIDKLQNMIDESKNIVFFGGAGVSTESGIKDFRSIDGLYSEKYDYMAYRCEGCDARIAVVHRDEHNIKLKKEKRLPKTLSVKEVSTFIEFLSNKTETAINIKSRTTFFYLEEKGNERKNVYNRQNKIYRSW